LCSDGILFNPEPADSCPAAIHSRFLRKLVVPRVGGALPERSSGLEGNDQGMRIGLGLSFDDVLLIPRRNRAPSRSEVDVGTMLTPRIRLAVPVVSANTPWCTEGPMATAMARLGGIGIIHRMIAAEKQAAEVAFTKESDADPAQFPHATVDPRGRLRVGAAVGVKGDFLHRAEQLVRSGADFISVDVAHGHADYVLDAIVALKRSLPDVDIIAGNVATAAGAADLIEAGAQAVKVGIGPGSVCSTRIVTGAGVPQLTAIMDCASVARPAGVPLIADGGIRTSGDIVKALAAGASTVMLGKLIAGAEESSAGVIEHSGRRYKITTGFVTLGVELTLKRLAQQEIKPREFRNYLPEGVEATFEYAGPVSDILVKLVQGLRSGLTYGGSTSIPELQEKAGFVQVTHAGSDESRPHVQDDVPALHPNYARLFVRDGTDPQ
jgi:IMP dehydrogenase/GMP reductase